MPETANAAIELTGYNWVPDFAKGHVRDIRARWALEEAGIDYRMRLFNASEERPEAYLKEQPFAQVPALKEGDIQMFESGAIMLYIADKSDKLMPRDPVAKARVTSWVFAALNSVETFVMPLMIIAKFEPDAEWAKLRRPGAEAMVRQKLKRLSDWLDEKDYLEGAFSIGDIAMASVLRDLEETTLLGERANIAAYHARCLARPAFKRALAAQMAGFTEGPVVAA
ncbi:MAG: glutathione S-transferase family protein [Hyphomonas oceanitis]|uniref:glutathione S-transferase family protein n=1 Tax=Hyphomonas oceanitis TaxID=81033 RepID=UPI003001AD89